MVGPCEQGNETSGSIKSEEFLDQVEQILATEGRLDSIELLRN